MDTANARKFRPCTGTDQSAVAREGRIAGQSVTYSVSAGFKRVAPMRAGIPCAGRLRCYAAPAGRCSLPVSGTIPS